MACVLSSACQSADDAPVARAPEAGLWEVTIHEERPTYPVESLRRGIGGVAVAELSIGADGTVRSVAILESPDSRIASSVTRALRQWTFQPLIIAEFPDPLPVRGKLTFYFVPEGSEGEVLSAREMAARRMAGSQ
jgi:TonB family protein